MIDGFNVKIFDDAADLLGVLAQAGATEVPFDFRFVAAYSTEYK